jgi:ubiquinone/menaquinone biosynthesis C-methylase UbiE
MKFYKENYFNKKYVDYWKSRVNEAGKGLSGIIRGDIRTEGDFIYIDNIKKYLIKNLKILDVGCAWGRYFKYFIKKNMQVYGIDISKAMLDVAKQNYGKKVRLKHAVAEKIPFKSNYFDILFCAAVFDCTDQNKSLNEFFRVTKINGKILFTGKNIDYLKNDKKAIEAEIAASKKKHPNSFSKVAKIIKLIENSDHKIIKKFFFIKRGDFSKNKFLIDMPNNFYEYLLIIKKGKKKINFSSIFSRKSNILKKKFL